MVTRPKPLWERWIETPRGREQAYRLYLVFMILLNAFILLGLILFFVFLVMRS